MASKFAVNNAYMMRYMTDESGQMNCCQASELRGPNQCSISDAASRRRHIGTT